MELTWEKLIVTGAAAWLGAEQRFARAGLDVVMADVQQPALQPPQKRSGPRRQNSRSTNRNKRPGGGQYWQCHNSSLGGAHDLNNTGISHCETLVQPLGVEVGAGPVESSTG